MSNKQTVKTTEDAFHYFQAFDDIRDSFTYVDGLLRDNEDKKLIELHINLIGGKFRTGVSFER